MDLVDILLGFVSYGSGLALGLAIGFGFGLYVSLIFHGWFYDWVGGRDPAKAVRKAIETYRGLNDSLWESEKLLEFPESVEEKEENGNR